MFVEMMDNAVYSLSHTLTEQPEQKDFALHSHNYCELLLLLSGDVTFHMEGEQYRLKPADMVLLPRHVPHCISPDSATRYENYVIHFHDSLLFFKHRERLFLPPAVFNIADDNELLALFRKFDDLHGVYGKEDFYCVAQCITQEILTKCCYMERRPARQVGNGGLLALNTLRYINTHTEEPLNADILAKEFNVSRSHLQNVFSEGVKIGLKQYIMQKKVIAAHDAMAEGMSAGAAAAKYGFGEYSTFYRLYKKVFGEPPSAEIRARKSK